MNMKHRRGIDFRPASRGEIAYLDPVMEPARTTFDDLPKYMALGGHCRECEHEGWVDRHDLKRKWPADKHFLSALAPKLRCRACGNKQHNSWILGQLPR